MPEQKRNIDMHFLQLVASLHMASLQNLGRLASPVTNESKIDMAQARISIDMLAMMAEKTEGNLTDDEKELIDKTLFELRTAFAEVAKEQNYNE